MHNLEVNNRYKSVGYSPNRRPKQNLPYRRREVLLSRGEAAFFRVLLTAVAGTYAVTYKVRTADLLTCSDSAWEDGFGYMISRHHVDFVLCYPRTFVIVAAIELDDRSHSQSKRIQRDEFLDRAFVAAGTPLIRFRAAARYCPHAIAQAISNRCDS